MRLHTRPVPVWPGSTLMPAKGQHPHVYCVAVLYCVTPTVTTAHVHSRAWVNQGRCCVAAASLHSFSPTHAPLDWRLQLSALRCHLQRRPPEQPPVSPRYPAPVPYPSLPPPAPPLPPPTGPSLLPLLHLADRPLDVHRLSCRHKRREQHRGIGHLHPPCPCPRRAVPPLMGLLILSAQI